jgi:hypothetical protein
MFRWALDLLLGTQDILPASQDIDMAEGDANAHISEDMPCFFLEKLPPELRFRIYEYLIVSEHRLVPSSRRGSSKHNQTKPSPGASGQTLAPPANEQIDISLFLLNKQIYSEAADIFYSRNKFASHYDYFCKCWSGRTLHLNEAHIKRFKIQGINFDEEYYPRLWDRCKVCDTQCFWLIKYLNRLPSLKSVILAFADVESFAVCLATAMRKLRVLGKGVVLETDEIGKVFITGAHALIELRLPSLIRTWPKALAKAKEPCPWDFIDSSDEDSPKHDLRDPSELDVSTYLGLRDIMYHAITAGSTTEELQPFMRKIVSPRGLHMQLLDAQDKAAFTLALVGCLADIIADDENVHMTDRRDLVELADAHDEPEKYGRLRAASAVNLRPYSYMTRF